MRTGNRPSRQAAREGGGAGGLSATAYDLRAEAAASKRVGRRLSAVVEEFRGRHGALSPQALQLIRGGAALFGISESMVADHYRRPLLEQIAAVARDLERAPLRSLEAQLDERIASLIHGAGTRLDRVQETVEDSADMIGFGLMHGYGNAYALSCRAGRTLLGLPDTGDVSAPDTDDDDMPGVNDRFFSRSTRASRRSARWYNRWARRWTALRTP